MADWADAQLNVLTQWANVCLDGTGLSVNDVCEDLQDGLAIIALIEHASLKTFNLKYNRSPRFPGQKLDNLTVAFKWIETNWKIKVPCNPSAIVEGQKQQCMGILFLIKNQTKKLEALAEEQRKIDEERRKKEEAEEAQRAIEEKQAEAEREAKRRVEEAKRLEEEAKAAEQRRLDEERRKQRLDEEESERKKREDEAKEQKAKAESEERVESPAKESSPIPKTSSREGKPERKKKERERATEPSPTKPVEPAKPVEAAKPDDSSKSQAETVSNNPITEESISRPSPDKESKPKKVSKPSPRGELKSSSSQPELIAIASTPEVSPTKATLKLNESGSISKSLERRESGSSFQTDESVSMPEREVPCHAVTQEEQPLQEPVKPETKEEREERLRREETARVEQELKAARASEDEELARKIREIEDSFASESKRLLSQLEEDIRVKREDCQRAQERHKTLQAEAKAAPTRDEREAAEGRALVAKIDAEDKQAGLKRLETRLGNEKKNLDEKRREEDAKIEKLRADVEHEREKREKKARRDLAKQAPKSPATSSNLIVTGKDAVRKDRSSSHHSITPDASPSAKSRPTGRPSGNNLKSDGTRKYQTLSSVDMKEVDKDKKIRDKKNRLSQDDLIGKIPSTRKSRNSEAIPNTRPLKNSDGSGSSSPQASSLSTPSSPTSLVRKDERDRERRRSVGGEMLIDRKERERERDAIASEQSPSQGSKSKLTVQEKRNMLKQQLAAGRNTVSDMSHDAITSERSTKLVKGGDGTSGFFDDKLALRNREWTLVFKGSPSGKDVNTKLVQLIRIQGLFRGKLERTFFLTKEVKNWKRRKMIAKEVLTTEEFYVQCLQFLVKNENGFWKQLSAPQWELAKHPEYSTIATIFQTAGVMLSFNELLLKGIRERMARFHQEQSRLDDVFKKFVGFLKVYVDYVNKYEKAAVILRKFCQTKPELQQLASKIKNDPENPKYLDLDSLLIMPIQRLPRYVMLLSELKSFTPLTHPHYADLTAVHKSMSDVATDVNLKKRMIENREAVIVISEHLSNYEVSNESIRSFERQGTLRFVECEAANGFDHIDTMLKTTAKKYVFLFNDILLVTETELKETKALGGGFGLFGKAKELMLGLEKSLASDVDGKEVLHVFSIDDLRDNPSLQFRYIRSADLFGAELIEFDHHSTTFGVFFKDRDTNEKWRSFFVTDGPEKYQDWLFDLDRAIATLLSTTRSRVSKDDLAKALDGKPEKDIPLDSICFSSIENPEWVENKVGCLKATRLVITNEKNDKLLDIDILDCDVALCRESDFPEDATKKYYFTIRKPNPDNKDKPFQYFFYATSSAKRRLWVSTIRTRCFNRLKEIDRGNNLKPLGDKKAASSMLPSGLSAPSPTEHAHGTAGK